MMGLYKKEEIEGLDLPLFYDYQCINGNFEFRMDFWTITEFKQFLNVTLTESEKSMNNIKAFKSGKGYFGWAGVYSLTEIMRGRGVVINYTPFGDNEE